MLQGQLTFTVTNDPTLDFNLLQEAWVGGKEVADIRQVDGVWQVTFFPDGSSCELSWQDLAEIYRVFSQFVAERTN
jgi:hypothetical protein